MEKPWYAISIHAPREGSDDSYTCSDADPNSYFNPRSP